MNRELNKIPGVLWGFSQPIADNVEEAISGIKGQLAVKVYSEDLKVLEDKARQIEKLMQGIDGIKDVAVFRLLGQPNLNVAVDRQQAARYQINVADVQDAIQTAVGGNALKFIVKSTYTASMAKKIYVGNLSFQTTETDLSDMFGEIGQVESVKIITDRDTGRSKGFGFIEMSDDAAAEKAITLLNGKEVSGRSLTVNEARPMAPRDAGGGRGGYHGGGGRQRW